MSDTPRTDHAPAYDDDYGFVSAQFARTLERELNTAIECIARLERELSAERKATSDMRNKYESMTAEATRILQELIDTRKKAAHLEQENARLLSLATEATSAT